MSRKVIFGYCEGRNLDPFVYSEVIRSAILNVSQGFEVFNIETLTGTGGKQELINLFSNFQQNKVLHSNFKGKDFCCVFFFDKDIDDLTGELILSKHAFYTELYDLEGQIYYDGNLQRAIAVALSIPAEKVPKKYTDAPKWIENRACHWERWLELCVYSKAFGVDVGHGYRRSSTINPALVGMTDRNKYYGIKLSMQSKEGISTDLLTARFRAIRKALKDYKDKSFMAALFKGKWLEAIIEAELTSQFSGTPVSLNEIGPRITSALTMDFRATSNWANQQNRNLKSLLAQCTTISTGDSVGVDVRL